MVGLGYTRGGGPPSHGGRRGGCRGEAIKTGFMLSQGGEFAFVLLSLAKELRILPDELNRLLIIVVRPTVQPPPCFASPTSSCLPRFAMNTSHASFRDRASSAAHLHACVCGCMRVRNSGRCILVVIPPRWQGGRARAEGEGGVWGRWCCPWGSRRRWPPWAPSSRTPLRPSLLQAIAPLSRNPPAS